MICKLLHEYEANRKKSCYNGIDIKKYFHFVSFPFVKSPYLRANINLII